MRLPTSKPVVSALDIESQICPMNYFVITLWASCKPCDQSQNKDRQGSALENACKLICPADGRGRHTANATPERARSHQLTYTRLQHMCHFHRTLPLKKCFLGGVIYKKSSRQAVGIMKFRDQVNTTVLDTPIKILIMSLLSDARVSNPSLFQRHPKSLAVKVR